LDKISATCISLAFDPDRYRTLHQLLGQYGLPGRNNFGAAYGLYRHKPYGLFQSHEVPTTPFEHASLDLVADLPQCDGYDDVVVFVCMLTKRTIVEPIIRMITMEQLAKVMHRAIFWHFGLPRKLISDRDPRFISDFWQTLYRVVGTKLSISTSYHPHTYGQTERVNQTWEQVIRCYVHPLHDNWVQHLTNVEFAINAVASTSTTMSPFKATLGLEPTSPTTATLEDNEPAVLYRNK
jgi:transposase InsO family protein